MMIRLLAFDLDNTLADTHANLTPKMANILIKLWQEYNIAIITARKKQQIINKFLIPLIITLQQKHPRESSQLFLKRLFISGNTGAILLEYILPHELNCPISDINKQLKTIYQYKITEHDRKTIKTILLQT